MKTETISYLSYWLAWFLGLVFWQELFGFYILMATLGFDTLTGVAKAIRFKRFKSGDMIRGAISKIFLVWIVILFAIIAQNKWANSNLPWHILSWLLRFLVVAESISIIQNTMMVRTGKEIEEWDAITFILNLVLDKLRKALQSIK